ncbi:MAG TPA: NAD(P)-dependent alcohol dehydrogenase [Steroidobacteraceae bacterium]|nr:NAD(P)-dependent alcohol dehydrogenase [Steroidobacteraceae bacterium]
MTSSDQRLQRRGNLAVSDALAGVVLAMLLSLPPSSARSAPEAADMTAVRYTEYGTSEVLQLTTVRRPVPGEHQVLIEVYAAAVNPLDWHYMRGTPYIMRLEAGLFSPKDPTLGVDVSGRVRAVGAKVTRFKPGDDVFGTGPGAFAQFVLASEQKIVHKPANLSFEQAAAVPVAALTALQGLRDKGELRRGQRVLINGASGGVGTFAVQIARTMGAHVTGVCSGRNAALVRSLGADQVVDYTQQDFTRGGQRYDLVLDLVGNRDLLDLRRVLKSNGRLVLIGGGGPNDGLWLGPVLKTLRGVVLDPFIEQEIESMLARINVQDLAYLAGLLRTGKVVAVIDRRYPLEQVPAAIDYLERGRARGKVIIEVAPQRRDATRATSAGTGAGTSG